MGVRSVAGQGSDVIKIVGLHPRPDPRLSWDGDRITVRCNPGIQGSGGWPGLWMGRTVLEPECLVAIAIYTLLAWGIVSLIQLIAGPPVVSAIE
jgi:hypothetical protein